MSLIKVKQTQVEMLRARGYTIPEDELVITKKTKLSRTYDFNDNKILYVHYINKESLADNLKVFVKKINRLLNGIIIGNDEQIKQLNTKKYSSYFDQLVLKNIQLFTIEELMFNITTSFYSPQYTRIDPTLIIPSIASAKQLPKLLIDDPIVKFYDYRPGEVIKVETRLNIDVIYPVDISYCIISLK